MIGFIFDIIKILSDKQEDVIIATIGFMSAAIVAIIGLFGSALTIMLNKRSERKVELRKIKESQYIEFLSSIAEAKIANITERAEINKLLSSRIQTIYLVGNKEVQKALHEFLNIFTAGTVLCMMATESSIHKNVFVKEQIYHFSFRKGKNQFH